MAHAGKQGTAASLWASLKPGGLGQGEVAPAGFEGSPSQARSPGSRAPAFSGACGATGVNNYGSEEIEARLEAPPSLPQLLRRDSKG